MQRIGTGALEPSRERIEQADEPRVEEVGVVGKLKTEVAAKAAKKVWLLLQTPPGESGQVAANITGASMPVFSAFW